MAKNGPLTEKRKQQIRDEAERSYAANRLREQADRIRAEFARIQSNNKMWGLDGVTIDPPERYTDLMKRVQEDVDISLVQAGLRDISITAEPVADDPPALPAPKESEE
jgi:hypothetical protein